MEALNAYHLLMIVIFVIGYFLITIEHVTKINNRWHRYFLVLTSAVFAFALADNQIAAFTIDILSTAGINTVAVNPMVKALAIVLPILWTLIISQVALSALSDAAIDQAPQK